MDKRPWFFAIDGGAPFAIGAIWEPGADLNNCCLLTTAGNAVLEPIHHRIPVIVPREDWEEWCAGDELMESSFARITTPRSPDGMSAIEVSPLVNSARVDSPACCKPDAAHPVPKPAQQTFEF